MRGVQITSAGRALSVSNEPACMGRVGLPFPEDEKGKVSKKRKKEEK